MSGFDSKSVVFIGKLATLKQEEARNEVKLRGGVCRRGVTRKTDIVVVGHNAYDQLHNGRLIRNLALADSVGAVCMSEYTFLRGLDFIEQGPETPRDITSDELKNQSGLGPENIRLLVLFDVLEPYENLYSFRDLKAAREVQRLLEEGCHLVDIVRSVNRLRKTDIPSAEQPLAKSKLLRLSTGEIVIKVLGGVADLDGQMRLPIKYPENPTLDDIFEAAEAAEEDADWTLAESLYSQILRLDRKDPDAPYNLSNMLIKQGRNKDAEKYLRIAVALDPNFPEAWYNLAGLKTAAGNPELAQEYLKNALSCDQEYADALYNLARLEFDSGAYEEASEHWKCYLGLDDRSDWAKAARDGLSLCRHHVKVEASHV